MHGVLVGIDVGGTFTDVVAVERDGGRYTYFKLPSTRHNPAEAALEGLTEVLRLAGLPAEALAGVSHGTTVATNAILEKRYAETALVTTEGFRDVLELARQRRPHLWDLDVDKPDTVARRDRRFELRERVDGKGEVLLPPTKKDIARLVKAVGNAGVTSVAICFLHSYANGQHEIAVAEALRQAWPDLFVCASSEVVAEFREYERFCSTVLNACLLPVMDSYLGHLEQGVARIARRAPLRIMQSNGGIMSARAARRRPIGTFLSGPSAGVVGAMPIAAAVGSRDVITFDMGGTSTDVCLIEAGRAPVRREQMVAGLPVKTPTVDIHTVGAGGGSIAWIDPGGLLKVGPRSAGASPGPACYGKGGVEPTVTDANMQLGRLNPRSLLGGRMQVDRAAAERAVAAVGAALGFDVTRAAAGILKIVNANMVQAIRVVSVERGYDPRDFALVAFGGAGPLHAAEIAKELGMRRVVVPERPGLLCAMGLLHSELRADFSRTHLLRLQPGAEEALNAVRVELTAEVESWQTAERLQEMALARAHIADLRYVGQDFELQIPLADSALTGKDIDRLVESFHAAHQEHYGYASHDQAVELVALRIMVTGPRTDLPPATEASEGGTAAIEEREVWFEETEFVRAPVYARERLEAGRAYPGPAVIEQMDSSILVLPGMTATPWRSGELVLEWL